MKPARSSPAAYLAQPPVGNALTAWQDAEPEHLTRWLPGTWVSIGWLAPGELSRDVWLSIVDVMYAIEESRQWWWGDLLNYGEQRYGETYTQALKESTYSYWTLASYKSVAARVRFCNRVQNLSWSHHRIIAGLREHQQRRWLRRAVGGGWSVDHLSERLLEVKRRLEIARLNASLAREPVTDEPRMELEPVGPSSAETWPDGDDDALPWDGDGDAVCCPRCGLEFVPGRQE